MSAMSLLGLSLHGKCHSIITALFSAGSGTRPRLCLNTTPQGKKNLLSNHPTGPQDKVSFPPAEPNVLMIRSPLHLEPCSHSADFFFFFLFKCRKGKRIQKKNKDTEARHLLGSILPRVSGNHQVPKSHAFEVFESSKCFTTGASEQSKEASSPVSLRLHLSLSWSFLLVASGRFSSGLCSSTALRVS